MKIMLTAFAAIAVISVAADMILKDIGYSSEARSAGDAVRLDAGS